MSTQKVWVVVPAAGTGSRMGVETPKQYLPIAGRSMLDWTLHQLLQLSEVCRIAVAVSPGDQQFAQQALASSPRVWRANGGKTRAESVLNGLRRLADEAGDDDCVLVHDAARPLIHPDDLRSVIQGVADHPGSGVILANPVADTLKRAQTVNAVTHQVVDTIDRSGVWQAQTPQAARFGVLLPALQEAVDADSESEKLVTDEAGALERMGIPVHLIGASHPNFKVTTPQDMRLADALLSAGKL